MGRHYGKRSVEWTTARRDECESADPGVRQRAVLELIAADFYTNPSAVRNAAQHALEADETAALQRTQATADTNADSDGFNRQENTDG